ncbi:MAG TPA: glycosyltransferase family 4 protein [Cellulomonas sp.]
MRILVYPHSMEMGGSQLNAVELAGAIRDRGNDVGVFGPDGPLVDAVHGRGLSHVVAPVPRVRPSPAVMRRLSEVVSRGRYDLVHAYEWPPAMEAVYGPFMRFGTPTVCTVMSMAVAPFIPPRLPLTVGTAELAELERGHRDHVSLLEPPVDTELNKPGDQRTARAELGVADSELLIVVVSRLAAQLKLEGILDAVRAVGLLASELPVRLLVAGDGPCRGEIEAEAAQVNAHHGHSIVTLTGNLADPRPAYDAADIILGMGGSALRGMAFAKPLVVQGERGYWRLLEPSSLPVFLKQGWYGIGQGDDGAQVVAAILRRLLSDPGERARLGAFSREVIEERFSLTAAASAQESLYRASIAARPSRLQWGPSLVRPLGQVAGYEVRRKIARRLGRVDADDFNSLAAMARNHKRSTP